MGIQLDALSRVNIDQEVYEAIAERIISGALPPGARITEEELAEQLGVSRTPIREAMKSLAKVELIELLPRRGAYVRQLSQVDLNEIYEIREILEGMVARLALDHVTREDLESLKEKIASCRRDLAEGRAESFLDADESLHSLLLERCPNVRLRKMLKSLNNLVRYFRVQVAKDIGRAAEAVEEHDAIISALEARDADALEAAAKNHIRITRERTLADIHFGATKGWNDEAER